MGGIVRDALLGRHAEYLDLDFVLPQGAVETARAIARHYQAGFVLLDAERQIARVVFAGTTADFAQQVGGSLSTDLERRDFTVNAIAYNPHTREVLDPLSGCADLKRRQIRMIALENLKEDPLRLLRAYRQAAQLGFSLEPETRQAIAYLAGLLNQVAPERVQSEINYLLSSAAGTPFLQLAGQDGALQNWLPHTTADSLDQVFRVDAAAIALIRRWPAFEPLLQGWLKNQPRNTGLAPTWLKLAKLASLVTPNSARAEVELWRLKYSRAEVQTVITLLELLPLLQVALGKSISPREQYLLFKKMGATFPALAVLAIASPLQFQPDHRIAALDLLTPWMERFLTPHDPIAHPLPLVTGNELMRTLQLAPGPQIGQLLEALQLAQAEGKVMNAEEAIALAQQWMQGCDKI